MYKYFKTASCRRITNGTLITKVAELLEVEESDLVESLVKRVIASGVEVRARTNH